MQNNHNYIPSLAAVFFRRYGVLWPMRIVGTSPLAHTNGEKNAIRPWGEQSIIIRSSLSVLSKVNKRGMYIILHKGLQCVKFSITGELKCFEQKLIPVETS